jgi:Ca2+-binding RTX toxin-like protein
MNEQVVTSLAAGEGRQDGDLYTGIENLEGGSAGDVLRGDAAANTLIGNGGADTLVGGGGPDLLFGNDLGAAPDGAADTASYADGRTSSVLTDLAGAHQDGDFYSDIQNLIGGDGNDFLAGDAGGNVLIGNNGADILVGAGGVDDLRGGVPSGLPDASMDVASYRDRGVSVTASLLGAVNPDGDLFSDISGLEGGGAQDTLTGDALANLLLGGGGNDTLNGLAGPDDLQGAEGDDNLLARDGERDLVHCGPGSDVYEEDAVDLLTECEARPVIQRPVVRCLVPNVKRRTVARARRMLNARRCRLGKVRRVHSRKVRKGLVVSQSRRPGARLPRNAKVNIVVSRGPRRR